ncbi:MAG: hypothetical protein ACP5N3_00075 [Candidatus Nanoarchaeia archaeon]
MSADYDDNKRGVYAKLREDFFKTFQLALEYEDGSTEDILNAGKEVERHVDIWNRMAEFMDYGVLLVPNLCRFMPIYFNRRFPNGNTTAETDEELFTPASEYDPIDDMVKTEYLKRYRINEWCPTINFNDAKDCEARLLKAGRYNSINVDHAYSTLGSMGAEFIGMNVVRVTYSNSMYHKPVSGEGPNELEAICDACTNFMNAEIKTNSIKANKSAGLIESAQ